MLKFIAASLVLANAGILLHAARKLTTVANRPLDVVIGIMIGAFATLSLVVTIALFVT